MTFQKPMTLLVLAMTLTTTPAMAAISISATQEQELSFTECTKSCTAFHKTQECRDFRRAKQICNQQKKTVAPQYSAAILEELADC